MENLDLNSERTLSIKIGHAFLLWHVLSNLAGETNFKSAFTAITKPCTPSTRSAVFDMVALLARAG
jgi:hypothetical protein